MRVSHFIASTLAVATASLATAPAHANSDAEDAAEAGTEIVLVAAQTDVPRTDGPPIDAENTVFDDNWLTVGLGAGIGPSYTGSDDYVVFPLPLVRGKLGPVRINPRPAGAAFDLLPKSRDGVNFEFGPTIRLRNDRADQVEDEVVTLAPDLDRAVEVGASGGVSVSGLLNPYDSLGFGVDARWDVAGAHDGMVIEPGVSYFTPLNRGTAISLGVGAEIVDDDFADYYYSVTPAQSAATGLPQFQAEGGLHSLGVNLLIAVDLDGDLANGGFGAFAIGGYSRLMGDAKDTPYTSIRGSADQFFGGVGVGYTF